MGAQITILYFGLFVYVFTCVGTCVDCWYVYVVCESEDKLAPTITARVLCESDCCLNLLQLVDLTFPSQFPAFCLNLGRRVLCSRLSCCTDFLLLTPIMLVGIF